jgi:hypothetical protein
MGNPGLIADGGRCTRLVGSLKTRVSQVLPIPDEVNIAVAVEYEDAFQADVKVTLDIPLYKRLLAFPWPEDDPILFPLREPGPFIGEGLRTTQFETLSDAEWATLINGYEVSTKTDPCLDF